MQRWDERANIDLQLFWLLTTFREVDGIFLLVALINLDAEDGRGGCGLRFSYPGMGVTRLRSRRGSATFVESFGVNGRHCILVSIEGIAKRELNAAFGAGEGEAFGVIRRNQNSDDRGILGVAGGVSLQVLASGNHGDILQHRGGLILGATVWGSGKENIDASAGTDETGDGDNLIDADGNGAHAGRNKRGQAGAGIFRRQLARQYEFAPRDWEYHTTAQHLGPETVGSSGQRVGGIFDDADVMLFDSGADLNLIGGDNDVGAWVAA